MRYMRPARNMTVVICLMVALSACQFPKKNLKELSHADAIAPKVALIELSVAMTELNAAGIERPMAEWDEAARKHIGAGLQEFMSERDVEFVTFDKTKLTGPDQQRWVEFAQLHKAVFHSLRLHTISAQLPHRKGELGWHVGDGYKLLREQTGADYGLFMLAKDSYSSPERKALMVVATLLTGVAPSGGLQWMMASLVDLRTGKVVWFHYNVSGSGDLREARPARISLDALLTDFPK